jgi:hypothetical protein
MEIQDEVRNSGRSSSLPRRILGEHPGAEDDTRDDSGAGQAGVDLSVRVPSKTRAGYPTGTLTTGLHPTRLCQTSTSRRAGKLPVS